MSGCVSFVRFYLVLGAIFDMLIGVACFIVATYIRDLNKDLLVMDTVKNSQSVVAIILYVLGAFTIITGITGIIGFYKRSKCLQVKFVSLNFCYFLFFAGIFAFNVYGKSYIDDNLSLDNCTTGPLKVANDLFANAKQVWCQTVSLQGYTIGCPCKIDDRSQWSTTEQAQLLTYNGILPTGTSNIMQCGAFSNEYASKITEINFLTLVEDYFSCTGICDGDIVFYFSDVNKGPPKSTKGCYLQIRDKIYDWLKLAYTYSIIAASVTLANVVFAFIHCCIGNKKEDKDDYSKVHNTRV